MGIGGRGVCIGCGCVGDDCVGWWAGGVSSAGFHGWWGVTYSLVVRTVCGVGWVVVRGGWCLVSVV